MIRSKVTAPQSTDGATERPNGGRRLEVMREEKVIASFETLKGLTEAFIARVVEAIEIDTETLSVSTAKSRARTAYAFLAHVAGDSSSEAQRVRTLIQAGDASNIGPAVAHTVELGFRNSLTKRLRANSSSLACAISNVNVVIRVLASRRLWPQTGRIPPEKIAKDELCHRPSLLEALGGATQPAEQPRDPDSTLGAAVAGLRHLGISVPQEQDRLSAALLEGERSCLAELRTAARRIFDQSYSAWSSMQPLIGTAARDDEDLLGEWLQEATQIVVKGGRDHLFESRSPAIFPANLEGLARLLVLLESFYMRGTDSVFHTVNQSQQEAMSIRLRSIAYRVRPALALLNLDLPHDLIKIRGLLTSSRDAVGSAAVLLMAETGLNTAPLISLPWSQVRQTSDPNWISIANWKSRANGTLIEEELEVTQPGEPTSAGAALMRLKEMSARHDRFVGNSESTDALVFMHAQGHAGEADKPRMGHMSANKFRASFKSVAEGAFGPECSVAPSSVRPSLLMTVRGHSLGIRSAQLAAGHTSAETTLQSYAGMHRSAHHLDQTQSIRDFQEHLQQVAIHNLPNRKPRSGISATSDLLNEAINIGLGALCLQLAENGSSNAADCRSIESCPGCSRLRISTRPEHLADLLAFGRYLEDHETWLQTFRTESWLTRWLPWSLLVDEVRRRGSRSTWAASLKNADEINAVRTPPSFPPLW